MRMWICCLRVRSVHCSTGTVEATCFPVSRRQHVSPAKRLTAVRIEAVVTAARDRIVVQNTCHILYRSMNVLSVSRSRNARDLPR